MASTEQLKTSERWLTQALEGDQRAVTFHELSREIGCHVHHAKNLMRAYLSSHPAVAATYLLSGPLLASSTLAQTQVAANGGGPATQSLAHMSATQKIKIVDMDQMSDDERNSEADAEEEREEIELEHSEDKIAVDDQGAVVPEEVARWGVVLVGQDALDEKKGLFEPGQVSVHVYALTPAPAKDAAQLLTCALAVREHKASRNPAVYGTITGDALGGGPAKAMRDGGMDFGKKAADKPKEVKEVKKEPKVEVKKEEPQAKARQAPRSKRRVIASSDEDEPEPPKASSSKAPASKKLEPTSSMVRADDQAAMEAMLVMDVDDFDDGDDEFSAKKEVKKEVKKKEGGKRKRRQVKKSKVEMDDKGYMVTKDYWTDESYSGGSETETDSLPQATTKKAASRAAKPDSKAESSSSKAPARPTKSAPPPKPAAPAKGPAKKGAMGQSTLAGFFKKK